MTRKQDHDDPRERIIDAAESAISRWGLERTRIDDIAHEARCGRTTIYRYFGNRESVIVQVLVRRGRAFGVTLLEHVGDVSDPCEKIVEGVVFSLKLTRDDELLAAIFKADVLPSAARLAAASQPLFELAGSVWAELLESDAVLKQALRPDVRPEKAAEWILRMMLSYLALPPMKGDGRALRRDLRLLLIPALVDDAGSRASQVTS